MSVKEQSVNLRENCKRERAMIKEIEEVQKKDAEKKVLIVNLSSIHELNYQLTVLHKLAKLDSAYPGNLPGLTVDFLSGNYNTLINDYKSGKIQTDKFINDLIAQSGLNVADPRRVKDSWNSLIDFNENNSGCCSFLCPPTLSTRQKFQKLLNYAKDNQIDAVYFISNTNPLNVLKVVEYLGEKFPDLIRADSHQIVDSSENLTDENNRDIFISQEGTIPKIYISASYCYHVFKTEGDNQELLQNNTTPGLLSTLCHKFKLENITVVSQFGKDLEQAKTLGIPEHNILKANVFYNNNYTQKHEINTENSRLLSA
jgi:hypothetical protein